MPKREKVPVTKRAMFARINRKLAHDDKQLRTSRSWGEKSNLGDFHILDTRMNSPVNLNVDPEALARELGALQPWEKMEE